MIAVLGAFDGYHRGHQRLLMTAAGLAARSGGQDDWGVVTFSPHPGSVIGGRRIPALFTDGERDILSRYFNVPATLKIAFTEALSGLSPYDFLDYMDDILPLSGIVVGADFRFGRSREGDAEFLAAEASKRGWSFQAAESLLVDGKKVASSSIRNHVAHGAMDLAGQLLGYPFFFSGTVVRGDGRGKKLGFPTANIEYAPEKILPKRGVYAASVFADSRWIPGALSIGTNPTFNENGSSVRAETHLIDFSGSLYGRRIAVFIESFLREEERFPSPEILISRMKIDVSNASDHFALAMRSKRDVYHRMGEILKGEFEGQNS